MQAALRKGCLEGVIGVDGERKFSYQRRASWVLNVELHQVASSVVFT